MSKPIFWIVACLCALTWGAGTAHAQTASATLVWDTSDTLANVQAEQTFLKVGSAAAVAITPTCVAKAQSPNLQTECTTPVASVPPAGTQITVTVSNGAGLAATTITEGGGPSAPVDVRVTITVTLP